MANKLNKSRYIKEANAATTEIARALYGHNLPASVIHLATKRLADLFDMVKTLANEK